MKISVRIFSLFFACITLAACSPARTGVIGGTLTTNLRPAIGISVGKPFILADSGRVWAMPKSNLQTNFANASFDYAVYTDPSVSPANRFAYAAIIRLTDKEHWTFQPETVIPGVFGRTTVPAVRGREGKGFTVRVERAGDWAGELLALNGARGPSVWLAKRWVFVLDTDARAIAEYREPWPEGLEAPERGIMLLRDSDAEYLRGFEKRAEAVFSFGTDPGDFTGAPPAAKWNHPREEPDVAALAGEVMYLENGDSDGGSYE